MDLNKFINALSNSEREELRLLLNKQHELQNKRFTSLAEKIIRETKPPRRFAGRREDYLTLCESFIDTLNNL